MAITITKIDGKPCYLTTDYVYYLERLDTVVDLAKRLRRAQKDYFRTRAVTFLAEAKQLERQLDDELESFK